MAVELLVIDAGAGLGVVLPDKVTGIMVALEFIISVSYFVAVLCDVVIKALALGIDIEVLTERNINVFAAVKTAPEFPVRMRMR